MATFPRTYRARVYEIFISDRSFDSLTVYEWPLMKTQLDSNVDANVCVLG